jgi:predicted MFS family arabinose efflux permease
MAQAGTTYAVVYGVIGRNVVPERRSWAMGITAAAGSFGQFLMVPVEGGLIGTIGWQDALFVCAALALVIAPLALGLREPKHAPSATQHQSMGAALREAFGDRSFQLLTAGYFVCGFQVVFIGVHMPSYLKDHGLQPHVATTALALIGLFNVFGTYLAGMLGGRWAKKYLLATIYALRSLAIVVFIVSPLTPWSVYVFAAVIGFLWLSTVPLTNGSSPRSSACVTCRCSAASSSSATRSAASSASGSAGGSTTRPAATTSSGGSPSRSACFAALVNLPIRERAILRPAAA